MKFCVAIALCLLAAACARESRLSEAEREVIGEFVWRADHSGMILELRGDHTYSLRGIGFGSADVRTTSGQWELKNGKVTLLRVPPTDSFAVVKKGTDVVLAMGGTEWVKIPGKVPKK